MRVNPVQVDTGVEAFHWPGVSNRATIHQRGIDMLGWAAVFFIIAIIAALFGFGGIAGAAAGIAKILFFIFVVLLVLSLIGHLVRGR
jgi:uncharacterized membrane protein YtjA (UPF0391 family)